MSIFLILACALASVIGSVVALILVQILKEQKEVESVRLENPPVVATELKFEEKAFEVGAASIEVVFLDGRKMTTIVYGKVSQEAKNGMWHNPYILSLSESPSIFVDTYARDPQILTGTKKAEEFITYIFDQVVTIVDDPKNPCMSMMGKIIQATITGEESHEVLFKVATVVPKEKV